MGSAKDNSLKECVYMLLIVCWSNQSVKTNMCKGNVHGGSACTGQRVHGSSNKNMRSYLNFL